MQEESIDNILVGIDGSEGAMIAARYAQAIASRFAARVTLLHVAKIFVPLSSFERNPKTVRKAEDASRAYGEGILSDADRLFNNVVPTEKVLIFGDPAEVICQVARSGAYDLVVVGSRGLGAVERFLLGSVSGAVVNRAPCLVLVVRKREMDSVEGREPNYLSTPDGAD